jgi:hypothetical protein
MIKPIKFKIPRAVNLVLKILLMFIFLVFMLTSCKKNGSCFSARLYKKHKNDFCFMDCPGVIGCDGKMYCNECLALTNGIKVKK